VTAGWPRSAAKRPQGAVSSALEILAMIARCGPGVTAREIATRLGLPPATAYRLINHLVGEEYLVRMPDLRGFAIGRRAEQLLSPVAAPLVPLVAREVIAGLRAQVRFAVHVVRYTPTALRPVDTDPDHPLGPDQRIARYLHAAAAGKLLLADADRWHELLPPGPLKRLTAGTLTGAGELAADLARVRAEQVAYQEGELRPEVACMAVPIRSTTGALAAGIVLSGPCERAPALRRHLDQARSCAERLAPLLT
jgi:DNA-binding IclR family transcriptional regulator